MWFNLGIIVLTVLILGLGFLIGFARGMKRSLLRTIIMIACFVIAFFCKDLVVDKIKAFPIEGVPLVDYLSSQLPSELSSLSANITGLIEGLLKLVIYLLSVLILHLLTLAIVYPICKIFVKKPPKEKKKKLFGGLIGLGMGLFICIFSIAPLVGFIGDLGEVASSVVELTDNLPSSEAPINNNVSFSTVVYADGEGSGSKGDSGALGGIKDTLDQIGILSFNQSFVGKAYSFTGGWYYNIVTSSEVNGKKTNLHTQVGALSGMVKLAGNFMSEDFMTKIEDGDFSSVLNMLGEMSDEQLDVVQDMLVTAVDALIPEGEGEGGEIAQAIKGAFEKVDLKEVNFEKEGEIIEKFSNYTGANNQEEINVETLVHDLSESTLILPIVSEMDLGISLEDEQKQEVINEINKVNNPKAKAQLEKLFGLTE